MPANFQELSNFIWSVADLLRGPYRPPQYERVMLPMTVLRRFDCVLAPTKAAVVKRYEQIKDGKVKNIDPILNKVAGNGGKFGFHNHSNLDFPKLKGDPDNIGRHLTDYIASFSENVRKIFEYFEFEKEIEKLEETNRLYLVASKFAEIDLHPKRVGNITMGLIFEDLIRRFNEAANETAGDHFTPREVIRLMVNMLLEPDAHILTEDKFSGERFDYLLANPPFGVDWKAEKKEIDKLASFRGYTGKLPRVNDGALLFLLHMIGHFQLVDPEQKKYGSRCAIVFNGSPLFTGGAGSGESEIRRWIIENDWLEAIVALPEQMFYNTGIGTFIWVVTNRKEKKRKGKIQLIDGRGRWAPMRRSLGDKRRYLTDEIIEDLTREHGRFANTEICKVFDNAHFGFRRITVERPLRLRFQITDQGKESFLDACPEFLDSV